MYYKLDEASLIVDPKGFPFREMHMPTDPLYKLSEHTVDSKAIYTHIKKRLLSNWVFYEPEDLVEFDFCLGQLSSLLTQTIKQYTSAIKQAGVTDQSSRLSSIEASLEAYLKLLLETTKRAQFYEVSLRLPRMFQHEFSICSLFFYTDNFRLMRLVSDIELRLHSHLHEMMLADHRQARKELAKAIISAKEFLGSWRGLFKLQPTPAERPLILGDGKKINVAELASQQGTIYQTIKNYCEANCLYLSSSDRIRLSLYCKILKSQGNLLQMGNFLQFCKNIYLTKQQSLAGEHEYWQTLYQETIQLLCDWPCQSPPTIQLNQITSLPFSDPEFPKFLRAAQHFDNEQFLICCNFYYKNAAEESVQRTIEKVMYARIEKMIGEGLVVANAEDVFEFILCCGRQPPKGLFESYLKAIKAILNRECEKADVYQLECSFMNFFKYFLCPERPQYFPLVFSAEFLKQLRALETRDLSPSLRRLTHFFFNQMIFFCLPIPEFEEHLSDLLNDPEIFKIFVSIYKRFLRSNQIVFKSNFKLLHKIVSGVYRRNQQTFLKFIDVVQLYWEIAARFLLLWGSRSYIEEDTDALKEHYDMILVKVMDLLPVLSKTHQKQQVTLCKYLAEGKDLYNKDYMKCWMNVLAYKHQTFSEHILHICVFIKDDMPQNHFKNMLKLSVNFQTPIWLLPELSEESSFTQDLEALTSEFAVEILEVTHSFFSKWADMSYDWVREMPELFWVHHWSSDRVAFYDKLLSKVSGVTISRWVCLDKLRKLEVILLLYNHVVDKLTEDSKKEIKIVAEIQRMGTTALQNIWRGFANTLSKECVEFFYSLYLKIGHISKDLPMDANKKQEEIEAQLCPTSSSSKIFQKTHIYKRFAIIRLCKEFFDSMEKSNPQNFTAVVEARIAAPIAVDYTGKPPIFKIFGRTLELIRTIEAFFCCSSDLQKAIKCKSLIPLSPNTLATLGNRFVELDGMIKQLPTKQTFLIKVSQLLIRQIKKFFAAFLLHQLLTLNNHLDEESFQKLLSSHMFIHRAMLSYTTTVLGFYEETHPIYLQVLQISIKTLDSAKPSELAKRKSFLSHFILNLFNLYLYSTFTLNTRVRSAIFSSLINHYESITGKSRKFFNKAILFYLRRNFNKFISFEITKQMQSMIEGDVKEVQLYESTQDIKDNKQALVVICTQAMVINLLARNNFNALGAGIRSIFGNREGSLAYLRYLEKVSALLAELKEVEESEIETIVLDVFGCLESIYEVEFQADVDETITLLWKITKQVLKIKLQIPPVRQNTIRLFLNFLFRKPDSDYMKPLITEDSNNYLLTSIGYESLMSRNYKSLIHLFNVLFLERTTTCIGNNWRAVAENFDNDYMETLSLKLLSSEDDSLLMGNFSKQSPELAQLLNKFVQEFNSYINQKLDSNRQYYLNFKVIMSLAVKFPSLIEQIVSHSVQFSTQKMNFLDYILDIVLPYSYRMVVQFVMLLAKTNSGFQTEGELLVGENFIRLNEVKEKLKNKIQSKDELTIINASKVLEMVVVKGPALLFSIYKYPSLPVNFHNYVVKMSQSFQSSLLQVLIDSLLCSKPTASEFLFSLLSELFGIRISELGPSAEENILYYNNEELMTAIHSNKEILKRDFNWLEARKLQMKSKYIEVGNFEKTQILEGEGFLWNQYNVLSEEQDNRIRKQSQAICQRILQLTESHQVSKNIGRVSRCIHTDSTNHETYSITPRKIPSPSFMPKVDFKTPTTFPDLCEPDAIQQPDTIFEPDGIDEPLESLSSQQVYISSFDNIATEPNSENQAQRHNSPSPRCSFDLIESQNNSQVVISRVQKMELMNDLENGVNVKPKLQFLSNDELDKMIAVSDGELLFHLHREKETRTGNREIIQEDQEIKRYLDEIYLGCRKNQQVATIFAAQQTVIVGFDDKICVKLVNTLLATESANHEKIYKLIQRACLNNYNLIRIAPLLTFMLTLKDQQAKYIERNQDKFEFPYLKSIYTDSASLSRIKFNICRLISSLIDGFIGLPIWFFGTFDASKCQFQNLPFSYKINLPQQSSLNPCRLVDIVLWNIVQPNQETGFTCLVDSIRKYIESGQRKCLGEYPYYRIEESEVFSEENVQTLASLIVNQKKRIKLNTPLNSTMKVLLQLYPTCYEVFMMEFLKLVSDEFKEFVEQSINEFKRFRLNYSLKPENCIMISKDPQKLERLIDSYLFFVREKNRMYEENGEYLMKVLTDVCFDLVPWFRNWRFQVQQRQQNKNHKDQRKEMLQKIRIYRQQRLYQDIEKAELQLLRHEISFANFRNKKINQFTSQYLKPIHEALSVGLLHSFVKGQELIQMMLACFVPVPDRIEQLVVVYRRASNIWKAALAFSNLFIDEDCSQYHTMSNLQTHQLLKSKSQIPIRTSSNNIRGSQQRRKSAKLSITTVNPFNIEKIINNFLKISPLIAIFTEEGCRLGKVLAKYGGLELKLKTIRRKKTGVVKEIQIDRQRVWFETMLAIDNDFVTKDIRIKFKDEMGVDYGGLTKQWLTLITKELFNPNFGLFELSANKLNIQPSKCSHVVPNHLGHFRKLGVLVGKALIDNWQLQINFTKSFLKHLLGATLYVEDLADIDPETTRSLLWILDNQIDESLEITFSHQIDVLGEKKVVSLMENGENIYVNESNKREYVKAVCKAKMTDLIRNQSKAFMQGLESVIPYSTLKHINYRQLGLYLAGMPTINLSQMKQYAQYNNYQKGDRVIEWFWTILQEFDKQTLANFMFFLTGSFKVPYGGFKEYPVIINKSYCKDHLPIAHTCFNTIDLPEYPDKKTLATKLKLSISEGKGFNVS